MRIVPDQLRAVLAQADVHPPPSDPAFRRTAVFLVLLNRAQTNLIVIRRADRDDPWANHLAFPGGHVEPGDADALAAAHRETHEEIGIPLTGVSVLGDLGHFQTQSHRVDLHAFVGFWRPASPLRPDPSEVAQIIEVPLIHFVRHHRQAGFTLRTPTELGDSLCYPLADSQIWGVTARIIHRLVEAIQTAVPADSSPL